MRISQRVAHVISPAQTRRGKVFSPKRLAWVDTGRGVAIILVVLFHTRNWIAATGVDTGVWTEVNTFLSSMRMPFFFVLSGLFAAKWLTASWMSLIRSKVLLFGWVLIVWSAIGITVQVSGLAAAGQSVGITTAVRDFLLSPLSPPYELWFIWALALFFVLAKATRAVPAVLQLAVSGLGSAVGLTVWFSLTNGATGAVKFYFFFLCGLHLRQAIVSLAGSSIWIRLTFLATWAAASAALFVFDLRDLPGLYFVNCVVGVLAGVALSTFLVRLPVLPRLGRQTLPIYLAHTPIVILLTILMFALPPVLTALAVLGPALVPLAAAFAIAVALFIHRLCAGSALRYLYEPPPVMLRWLGALR